MASPSGAVSAQNQAPAIQARVDVFDRSTQGIKLTPQGELVVSYAAALLSINDQILRIGGEGPRPELVIRVGTPRTSSPRLLPATLAAFSRAWPDVRFIVRTDFSTRSCANCAAALSIFSLVCRSSVARCPLSLAARDGLGCAASPPNSIQTGRCAGVLWRGLHLSPARRADLAKGRTRLGRRLQGSSVMSWRARSLPGSASCRSSAGAPTNSAW